MKELKYVDGDVREPIGEGIKLICHICNDQGVMGSGVAKSLFDKWYMVKQDYIRWYNEPKPNYFELGELQFISCEEDIYVANMIAQHMVGQDEDGNPPIRYDALIKCLRYVARHTKSLHYNSVHIPYLMGCGLAKGNWKIVEQIILDELSKRDIKVYIYQLK